MTGTRATTPGVPHLAAWLAGAGYATYASQLT